MLRKVVRLYTPQKRLVIRLEKKSKHTSYISNSDKKYNGFFKYLTQYAAQKSPEWKHIPKEAPDRIIAEYGRRYAAYAMMFKPHTKPETREKNRIKAETEKALRLFVNRFLRHLPVTDQDRYNMSIPNPKGNRSVHIEVLEMVEFSFRLKDFRQLYIDFKVKGNTGKAKPDGYDGDLDGAGQDAGVYRGVISASQAGKPHSVLRRFGNLPI